MWCTTTTKWNEVVEKEEEMLVYLGDKVMTNGLNSSEKKQELLTYALHLQSFSQRCIRCNWNENDSSQERGWVTIS